MRARGLSLLRHAKAVRDGSVDRDRALADAGREQCASVAEHLTSRGRVPQVVLCSAAVRTRQTWELLAASLPDPEPEVRFLDSLYLGDVADILDALAELPEPVTEAMVLAHDPGISESAYYLADADSDPSAMAAVRVGVPTAGLCLLSTDVQWAALDRSSATLTEVARSPHG